MEPARGDSWGGQLGEVAGFRHGPPSTRSEHTLPRSQYDCAVYFLTGINRAILKQ
ncbi:hypothetical protein HMPREF0290_0285 [Corynebacterium efficiens YS-314]|uniref:Uncharacterized protein n=1 Tax=Corynebacterium efficiens (strain DSM 44549 / YS-314 / AJ 12310 / JCM 11189 / NBRC 100395) TaxID=196164 RepID=Q8FMC1_COREF|nr:hypothetical protein HMPREF0290_0285 [Corynebacterium efficiens YS-314]BAC19396.1 hypothetical protein [Corynebacterium efficiens YS-314]